MGLGGTAHVQRNKGKNDGQALIRNYKIRSTVDFSFSELLKEKCQLGILHSAAKTYLKKKGKIQILKQKLTDFISSRSIL